jgi:hypothetical protein
VATSSSQAFPARTIRPRGCSRPQPDDDARPGPNLWRTGTEP